MHLYIIRHAQSANNQLYHQTGATLGRHPDPPLTGVGHQQALHLARFLAGREPGDLGYNAHHHNRDGFDLTHLYTSLMIRSIQTGCYVAEATGRPLLGWPELHERGGLYDTDDTGRDFGVPGPSPADLAASYPQLVLPDLPDSTGWWGCRPRETVEEAVMRARNVWEMLVDRHGESDDRVAIITHGGFFQSLMSVLLTPGELVGSLGVGGLWFGINNVAVSRLELSPEGIAIRYLNRVDFLPGALVTG